MQETALKKSFLYLRLKKTCCFTNRKTDTIKTVTKELENQQVNIINQTLIKIIKLLTEHGNTVTDRIKKYNSIIRK